MKVLYLNNIIEGGGAEKITRQLYYGMRDKGVDTWLLTGYDCGESPLMQKDSHYRALYTTNIARRAALARGCLYNNALPSSRRARESILDIVRQNDIDIVHINNAHGNYIGIEDIAYIAERVKTIWTLHDMWAVTGHCAHAFECGRWRSADCGKCERKRTYPAYYYNNLDKLYEMKRLCFTGRNITFVTPSYWLENICRQSYLANERIVTINNGVDTAKFRYYDRRGVSGGDIPAGKNVILFCASSLDNEYKGYSYLIEALKLIRDKSRYCLLVIGRDIDADALPEGYDIRKYGYIAETSRMNEIYAMADVFVLPSVAETFGCVALESLASGTPIIAFETGGIPEIVSPETGWVVERKNSKKLAKQIENAFEDRDSLAAMRPACRARAEKLYTLDGMLERYKTLYEQMQLD